jgi:hypothetical protein
MIDQVKICVLIGNYSLKLRAENEVTSVKKATRVTFRYWVFVSSESGLRIWVSVKSVLTASFAVFRFPVGSQDQPPLPLEPGWSSLELALPFAAYVRHVCIKSPRHLIAHTSESYCHELWTCHNISRSQSNPCAVFRWDI